MNTSPNLQVQHSQLIRDSIWLNVLNIVMKIRKLHSVPTVSVELAKWNLCSLYLVIRKKRTYVIYLLVITLNYSIKPN